jgi:hypothetical protein
MHLSSWIWLTTGGIVTIAIATKTNIIRDFMSKVEGKNPQAQGFYYGGYYNCGYNYDLDDYEGGGCGVAGFDPSSSALQPGVVPPIPALPYDLPPIPPKAPTKKIAKQYVQVPFDYTNTESIPRATADQQAEEQEPLVYEQYPSHIEHQYTPPPSPYTLPPQHPNQHLCTGVCKQGVGGGDDPCDSQGFCIDSGCGSVIRGGSQCKKKKKHHNKIHPHNEEEEPAPPSPYPEPVINAQIECPDDLSTICGANCYKNGRLWKIVCSEQQLQDLYPSQVTPMTPPSSTPPSSTISTPTTTSLGVGGTPYPVKWNHNYHGSDGPCITGKLGNGPTRDTCRYEANLENLYSQNYAIVGSADIGAFSPGSDHHGGDCTADSNSSGGNNGFKKGGYSNSSCGPRLEITSGGPGSSGDSCCGFTMSVNNWDGTLHMEQEGPGSSTGDYYCSDSLYEHYPACTQKGASVTNNKPIYGQHIDIAWVKCGNRYGGIVKGPAGRVPATGVAWSPRIGEVGMITQCPNGKCSDSTRIRVDSAGLSSPYGRDPVVYTNPNTCGETVDDY